MSGACLRAISASKRFTSCLDSSVNSSLPLSKYRIKEIGRDGWAASALPKTSFTSLWLAVPRCIPPSGVVRAAAYAVLSTALPFWPWTTTVPTLPSLSGKSTSKSWLGVAQLPRTHDAISAAQCRRMKCLRALVAGANEELGSAHPEYRRRSLHFHCIGRLLGYFSRHHRKSSPAERGFESTFVRSRVERVSLDGAFESSLRRGTLSVVSGKIAKQSPDAMKVKTPSSILGVRGTEFLVRSSD